MVQFIGLESPSSPLIGGLSLMRWKIAVVVLIGIILIGIVDNAFVDQVPEYWRSSLAGVRAGLLREQWVLCSGKSSAE